MAIDIEAQIRPVAPAEADYPTGWVAPNGDFFSCDTCNHHATARRILETLPRNPDLDNYGGDNLYSRRYIHIGYNCQCDMGVYRNNMWRNLRPSQAQVNTLYDIAATLRPGSYDYEQILEFIRRED